MFTTTANITIVAKGTWTGAIDNDWNKPGNWTCGTMPAVITDITIPGTIATFPVIAAGSVAVNNLTLDAGASLTVTNATFVINGSVTDNGGSITANHGKVTFNGSTAQTIPAGLFASNTVKDLVINNPAGVTLAGTLRVAGILSFGNLNNNVFNTGGFLTLASTASGTGQVGDLTNNGTTTGNTINGMVTVERFVTPRRAYRFMTAPVNSTTIRQNWMENTNNATTSVNNNPVPGYGTHVTGSGGNVNGFDATATNNPSLFTFDNATQSWISATSTSLPLKAGIPYRVFVRGNRSINLNTNTPTPTTTTLRATGTLFTGNLVLAKPGGGGTAGMPQLTAADTTYSLVANPYAAVVNWKTVTKNDVSKNIYYFDPTIAGSNGRGGYVSYNELYDTVSNPSSNLNYFIQSGQAFFVRTTGPNPSITFRERDKASTHRPVFRPASVLPAISVRLMLPGKELTEEAADGLAAYFSDDLKTEIGEDDCYKFSNQDENIAILRNGKNLSIEGRKSVKDNDTLPLKMWQLTQKRYTLKVGVSNFSNNVESYLEDAWLATSTRLNNNHETSIPFSITSNAASSATDRFRIVFKTVVTLPVQMTGVKAYEKNKGVEVEWTAENESNIDRYEVEKSASAVQFATAGSVTAKNNGATASAYNWFDANVWTGDNFYRIKSVDNSGHIKYSQVVKVQVSPVKNQLPVSVNQVQSNSMNLVFTNAAKGKYGISLINSGGQKVYEGTISHAGGSTTNTIKINNSLAVGVYQMQVYYKNTRQNIPVLIQ